MPSSQIPAVNAPFRRGRFALATCAAGLCLLPGTALAAEWTRGANMSVGAVYSDNVELESRNEQDDLYGVVMPSLSLQGTGARANLNLDAALEMNSRSGGGTGNYNPYLNADGEAEFIEDFFYTSVFARAGQTTTDPFRASSDSSLTENENTGTTYSYGVEPSIRTRLGSFATFNASTRWDQQVSANDDFDDSAQQDYRASLRSGPDFSRLSWGIDGNHRITDYDDNAGGGNGQDDEYSSVTIPLGYRLSRKWQLTASVGREWQDYDAQESDRDDDTWDVGMVWTPTTRTSLNVGYGDRYFDNTPRFDFSHRSKRTTIRASYDRTLTTTRDLRARELDFGQDNPFGLPFDPSTGQPIPISENRGFLDSGSVIDERLQASIALQGRVTTLTLRGQRSEQTREDNSDEGTFDDLNLDLSRALSSKLSLSLGARWEGDEDPDGLTADTMRYYLGLSRQLGLRTSMSFNYQYSDRDSERVDDDYTENRVSLNMTFTL
jgi:uncharacterized protein (PEP-CTERM system associated)